MIEVNERDRKDYFTPSTGCFESFCESCIRRYGLEEHIVQQETVSDVDYDVFPEVESDSKLFRITTNRRVYLAKTVVMAVGGGQPVIPKPFPQQLPATASHAMWLSQDCVLSKGLQKKIKARQSTNVLVVGGGLTSAQISDCLIRKGVDRVHHVMRGPWKGRLLRCSV